MALPYFIEYLLTLQRPGGGRLVHVGLTQTILPSFPPNTTLDYQSRPRAANYGTLWFRSHFSQAMVPNAFTAWGQQYGAMWMTGTLTQLILSEPADYYILVTRAEPFLGSITNITNLNQYYEGITAFVNIRTEEDFRLLRIELEKLKTSYLSGFAEEALKVLKAMAGVRE